MECFPQWGRRDAESWSAPMQGAMDEAPLPSDHPNVMRVARWSTFGREIWNARSEMEITKYLPGRTDANLKNRHSVLKRRWDKYIDRMLKISLKQTKRERAAAPGSDHEFPDRDRSMKTRQSNWIQAWTRHPISDKAKFWNSLAFVDFKSEQRDLLPGNMDSGEILLNIQSIDCAKNDRSQQND
jgi:hypothetical protein